MSAHYYTVKASVPGNPTQAITTVASGPMAAVSAITRFMADRHPAHLMKGATFACRSGWWFGGERIDPVNSAPAALADPYAL